MIFWNRRELKERKEKCKKKEKENSILKIFCITALLQLIILESENSEIRKQEIYLHIISILYGYIISLQC